VAHASPSKHGWRIRIEATNTGDVAMPPGELLAVVVDAITEEHLGEAATTIPEVLPGQTHTVKLTVPTTRPTETALIGASFASPHDRNRHNSDVWHMTAEDLDELNDHVAAYGHLHGFSTIPDDAALEIVAAPAAWVTSGGLLCVASVARGTTTDPSIHVERPEYRLARPGSAGVELESVFPAVWTITPSHPGELPAVKSYACFDLSEEVCGSIEGAAAGYRLDLSIALGEVRRSTSAELGPELDEKTRDACRERMAAVIPAPPES
jgi:hypothetical protein